MNIRKGTFVLRSRNNSKKSSKWLLRGVFIGSFLLFLVVEWFMILQHAATTTTTRPASRSRRTLDHDHKINEPRWKPNPAAKFLRQKEATTTTEAPQKAKQQRETVEEKEKDDDIDEEEIKEKELAMESAQQEEDIDEEEIKEKELAMELEQQEEAFDKSEESATEAPKAKKQEKEQRNEKWPRNVMIKNSSLWALGADAREPMKKYDLIPLVTWTKDAERFIAERWQNVQHRATCDRAVWFQPWPHGITSQLRDYTDLAIISVFTFHRTIVPIDSGDERYRKWCPDAYWLECFFKPFQGDQCHNVTLPREGEGVHGLSDLGSKTPYVKLKTETRGSALLHEHETLFPNEMWDALVARQDVVFQDPEAPHAMMDARWLKRDKPELYYSLSLSALRAILAHEVLHVRPNILAKAQALVQDMNISPHEPVVAIHFRRTDKKDDWGVTDHLSFSVSFVLIAVARLNHVKIFINDTHNSLKNNDTTDLVYRTFLVLSDDPRAIEELRHDLGPGYQVHGLSDLKAFFKNETDYNMYLKKGHTFLTNNAMWDKDPQAVQDYDASVIVDAVAAGLRADYLIGMGCSGVSQLIGQWIGGRQRTEGNALSLWQEDLVL